MHLFIGSTTPTASLGTLFTKLRSGTRKMSPTCGTRATYGRSHIHTELRDDGITVSSMRIARFEGLNNVETPCVFLKA